MAGLEPVNNVVNGININAINGINNLTPVEMAKRMFEAGRKFDERELMLAAVDVEEVLRLGRQRVELRAMKYAPEMVDVLEQVAREEKNVKAARTVLEVAGALGKSRGEGLMVANQINISSSELERLERELER